MISLDKRKEARKEVEEEAEEEMEEIVEDAAVDKKGNQQTAQTVQINKEGRTLITRLVLQGFKSFNKKVSIPFLPGFNIIAGPNGSGKSLSYDNDVLLTNGQIKPIGEIVEHALETSKNILKIDDGIYTQENPESLQTFGLDPQTMKVVKKDISAFIRREGEPYLIKIRTATGKEIVSTKCHPVMVFKNGKIEAIKLEDLKEGQRISTPKKLDIQVDADLIQFPEFNVKKEARRKEIAIPTRTSEDFARFLGYFLGDGTLQPSSCRFTNEEKELLEDFSVRGERIFNIAPKRYKYKDRNVYDIIFFSATLESFLENLFAGKFRSGDKHIPLQFLFANEGTFSNLLASLFDCDGHVVKKNAVFEYATKSRKLADQVQFLLLRLGIVSKIKERQQRATNSLQKKETY